MLERQEQTVWVQGWRVEGMKSDSALLSVREFGDTLEMALGAVRRVV